jgi:hypothetical protein
MIIQATLVYSAKWLSTGQVLAVLLFMPLIFISFAYLMVLLFFRWTFIVKLMARQFTARNIIVWKRLLLNGLVFLGLGSFVSYGIGLFSAKGFDIPRELEACYLLFVFACASPGFLIPYGYFGKIRYPKVRGFVTVLAGGLLYPISLFWLNYILIKILGVDVAQFDKLVEVQGWLLLILTTLGPGIILSFSSLKLETVLMRTE